MDKIKISIDGKEIFAESGKTVLKIAAENGITLGELQQNAMHVLNFVMNSQAMNR